MRRLEEGSRNSNYLSEEEKRALFKLLFPNVPEDEISHFWKENLINDSKVNDGQEDQRSLEEILEYTIKLMDTIEFLEATFIEQLKSTVVVILRSILPDGSNFLSCRQKEFEGYSMYDLLAYSSRNVEFILVEDPKAMCVYIYKIINTRIPVADLFGRGDLLQKIVRISKLDFTESELKDSSSFSLKTASLIKASFEEYRDKLIKNPPGSKRGKPTSLETELEALLPAVRKSVLH